MLARDLVECDVIDGLDDTTSMTLVSACLSNKVEHNAFPQPMTSRASRAPLRSYCPCDLLTPSCGSASGTKLTRLLIPEPKGYVPLMALATVVCINRSLKARPTCRIPKNKKYHAMRNAVARLPSKGLRNTQTPNAIETTPAIM